MDISVSGSSTVLLASPFVDERTAYAAALRDRGYELREVADAVSLVAAAEAEPPDLIICEIMLPDADALTVSRKLRAIPLTADVPFMIVSATVADAPADGAVGIRQPCPTDVVVRQAEILIAFAASLQEEVQHAVADTKRLVDQSRRLRDESRATRWYRLQ